MEIIPFLIFAFIAFKIFGGLSKSLSSDNGESAKTMMKRLNAQIQETSQAQKRTSNQGRYQENGPTARGRERLEQKNQNSPWGENGAVSPGARVAADYLKKTKAVRKASHKSPVQRGRRGKNMDQNRQRTDGWGQRGDNGLLTGKAVVILLIIGGGILYALSQMPVS